MIISVVGQRTICLPGTKEILADVMEKLIEEDEESVFLVSKGSELDHFVTQILQDLKKKYPDVRSTYLWNVDREPDEKDIEEISLYHDDYLCLPLDDPSDTDRYALCGMYMADACDAFITYYGENVTEFGWGKSNAKLSLDFAKINLKRIINVYDLLILGY